MLSPMNIVKMLVELREEHSRLGDAIIALERLASGHGRRRGRPPARMKDQSNNISKPKEIRGSKNKAGSEA
jgi:hypothetical protein